MQTLGIRRLFVALAFAAFWALTPGGAEATLPPSVGGQWQNGPNLPFFPPHLHLLPDGRVMMWPGDGGVSGDDPHVWNPVSGTLTTLGKAGFDIFCTGHTFLPDGRLFVAGGHTSISVGLPDATIYNRANNTWARQPRMNLGRWYPTVTLLPNGDVLVVSGSVDTSTGSNPLPQVWQSATGTWRSLTSAELALPLYPYMFLAPNGAVFNAGPAVTTRYLNTDGTGAWSVVGDRTYGAGRSYGSAVMYEPGKVLIVGGGDPPTNTAEVIDLNAASPKWRAVSPMSTARRQMNATVLPDGKVLVTGGTRGAGFNNADPGNPVLAAELWNPATESWTVMESDTLPRLYHAAAMLLPDGRVLMTGGNGNTQSTIFSPPYLFTGSPRPTITSAPATVAKGQSFLVGTPDTGINMVAWVGLPSVTHTNNMSGAIFRSTAITQASGGINIVAPNNISVPAGHYMLFVLRNGVPSVARIVQLGTGTALPAPTLTSMAPNSAVAGGGGFTLNVTGANFLEGSTVRWNGANRTTTFVSGTQLSVAIPGSDIAAAGTAQVTVVNPAPGGGTSAALSFTINPSGTANPAPTLGWMAPSSTTAGGGDFTLMVNGSNFVSGSRVRWNGSDRPTTFVSLSRLSTLIPASDIAAAGTAQVTVFTPAPGGGTSAAQSFTINPSQDLSAAGGASIIARVTAPLGGGSRNIEIIRDGVMPPVGNNTSSLQYDTWDGENTAPDDWIGYAYAATQTFNRVVFQEGRHFSNGGWFNSLTVQVRQGGTWVNVPGLSTTPTYPGVNDGISYQTYTLRFTPVSGDAIRIFGQPGGSASFISVGELRVHGTPGAENRNLTLLGSIIAKVTAPLGGGSRNIEIIRDGVMPPVGNNTSSLQYDTWDGENTAPDDWIGYAYAATQTFNRVVFQEGRHFSNGGWFNSLTVQVRQGGTWANVPGLSVTPTYPGVNDGMSYQTYTLRFTPISGNAIRIFGQPGGSASFISVGELQVYGQ